MKISTYEKDILEQVKQKIEQEYHMHHTIDALAKHSGISATKLKLLFRMHYSITIFGLLHNIRMAEAEHLLEFSDLSLKQIAYKVGYHQLSNFSTAFLKHGGERPLQYRKNRSS